MSYQALYRRYRPQSFKDVVGQNFIVKTLENAIQQKKISHAYLFAGPKGTGKTSIAKIFSKTINCQNKKLDCDSCQSCLEFKHNTHPDIIELDAASNNSVDDIRELVDKIAYAPLLAEYKVYIIDEVHMLSNSAFNALLKTLEEPPHNVIFILATTDPHKVIPTVMSRVQRYNFSRVKEEDIAKRLEFILTKEKIEYDYEVVKLISELADGGLRDALSILDQCLVYSNNQLKKEAIYNSYGILSIEKRLELIEAINEYDLKKCLELKNQYLDAGIDLKRLMLDLLKIYKEMYFYIQTHNKQLLKTINTQNLITISSEQLLKNIEIIMDVINQNNYNEITDSFELLLMKLCHQQKDIKQNISQIPIDEKPIFDNYEKVVVEIDKQVETDLQAEFFKEDETQKVFDECILSILNQATKDEKNKDISIFENLKQYEYNSDYRKIYLMLEDMEVLASSKDAIVIISDEKNNINDILFNKEIYGFLVNVLKLDKMVYAIGKDEKNKYFDLFRKNRGHIKTVTIIKHQLDKKKTLEDELYTLFGNNLKVEE